MQALHHDPVPKDVLSMMVDQGRTVTSGQEINSENSGIQDNNGKLRATSKIPSYQYKEIYHRLCAINYV